MEDKKIIYNELPVISFRWLRANHLSLVPIEGKGGADYSGEYVRSGMESISEGLTGDDLKAYLLDYKGTNEEELGKVVNHPNVSDHIESGKDDSVRFSYFLNADIPYLYERNTIKVKKNEKLTVILEYGSDENAEEASVLNLIDIEEGGELNLIKINHLSFKTRHLDQRYAKVAEGGKFRYISVDLGGSETIVNYAADLNGDESEGHLKSIYIGDGDRTTDLFHIINHRGKMVNSDMELRGVLKDRSRKFFRGTLDFKKGSAGSEGSELETVMLLSPDVRSVAVPLLLCTEDDVIGNHAASAGQIDDEKLFYLMSRGFGMEESKRIIVESSFRPIIDSIPDEEIRNDVVKRVEEMMKKVD